MQVKLLSSFILLGLASSFVDAQTVSSYLSDNTILIVRHAEKPVEGTGLTSMGQERARLYAKYFEPYQEDGFLFHVDSLYAGADSKKSMRPRLTLEPLSKATGMPLHASIGTKNSKALVAELAAKYHGQHPLIAWRHSEIPELLTAFGVSPENILPNGIWPDDVFNWVVVLTTNAEGQIKSAKLVPEHLMIPSTKP